MTNNAKNNENMEKQEKQEPDHVKRNRLKGLVAGSVLVAASSAQWNKPVVNSVLLPVHAQTSPAPGNVTAGPGAGSAMLSFTVTDPTTNVASLADAPFGFRVGMVDATTGDFEVMISPSSQTASRTQGSGAFDWLVQPAIAQTANQIVITGGSLTGTVDLVNGGEAEADGNLILGTGEGVGCDCPVLFTIQYNAQTRRIEFDQAEFELDYDIAEFIGTCASLNLNITELGGVTITAQAEDFEAVPVVTTTTLPPDTEFAPADAAEFHARFNTALRTPGNWRKHFSFDTQRTLELSLDGATAIERKMHDRSGNPITGRINYDAGWTYEKTGPNTGTLYLMDNPSDYEFDRTLFLTFESARSGTARYVEYNADPGPNDVSDYTVRFEW